MEKIFDDIDMKTELLKLVNVNVFLSPLHFSHFILLTTLLPLQIPLPSSLLPKIFIRLLSLPFPYTHPPPFVTFTRYFSSVLHSGKHHRIIKEFMLNKTYGSQIVQPPA